MRDSRHAERPLSPGDLLETIETEGTGRMVITKYIGFEPAQWFVPELKPTAPVSNSEAEATAPETERALQN